MAAFSDSEKQLLANVLPGVAAVLRPSLNAMHTAAQLLMTRNEMGDSPESAIMRQSYYRLLRLVGNLDMAQELLSDTPFLTRNEELTVLLDELCRQADSIARECGVTVSFVCAERYVVAAVHRAYLERLVWNLLSNALKFTPAGGTITLTLEPCGSQILLSVRDTGCGIPPEQMETLFSRWSLGPQPALPVHGMGLGLPICRRVAEGHGGRLLLESREGQGTLVTVALPHVRHSGGLVRDVQFDYAGGFSHVMLELSDALPYQAFFATHLD